MASETPTTRGHIAGASLPAVMEVASAVTAFIGYTEHAFDGVSDLTNVPTRIESLGEFEDRFGAGRPPGAIQVQLSSDQTVKSVTIHRRFYLYDSLRLYFDNGGGACYVVSVGGYETEATRSDLHLGLEALAAYDEPTTIACPDAVLLERMDFHDFQNMALRNCGVLQDRLAILDLSEKARGWQDCIESFRNNTLEQYSEFGAAYGPWLKTSYSRQVPFESFRDGVTDAAGHSLDLAELSPDPTLSTLVLTASTATDDALGLKQDVGGHLEHTATLAHRYRVLSGELIWASGPAAVRGALGHMLDFLRDLALMLAAWPRKLSSVSLPTELDAHTAESVASAFTELVRLESNPQTQVLTGRTHDEIGQRFAGLNGSGWLPQRSAPLAAAAMAGTDLNYGDPDQDVLGTARRIAHGPAGPESDEPTVDGIFRVLDAVIHEVRGLVGRRVEAAQQALYEQHPVVSAIVRRVTDELSMVPPSGAVAGLYSYMDRRQGVWTAPAGVPIASVTGPTETVDDAQQALLLADASGRKSINAIRAIPKLGTVVWGARTLARSDSEWCYVPARRLFNMIGESLVKSLAWSVFERNDVELWARIQSMVHDYLMQKWRVGALMGASPSDACFVKVGLGQSMTPTDLQEGRLIVEVGMAIRRPREFSVLVITLDMITET